MPSKEAFIHKSFLKTSVIAAGLVGLSGELGAVGSVVLAASMVGYGYKRLLYIEKHKP